MPSSRVLTLGDPYEYQRSVRAADLKLFVAAPGIFEAKLTRIDLHRLWMQRSWLSLPSVTYSAVHAARNVVFFLADAHQTPMSHSGIRISPDDIIFNAPGAEHYHRSSANCSWAAMSLTPADFAAFGRLLVGRDVTAPVTTRAVRPAPALICGLRNLHKAAADLAATAPDILAHPEVAKAIEQALVGAMIACVTDPVTEDSYRSNRRRVAVMRRFEQMLEAQQDQPLYITDVCAAIGVTDRTLRLHCQEHLGMGPHRYLWLRRMNMARRALSLADGTAKTVTEIANDHGFGELGRFAVAYRELFGESPSLTLRRPPDDRRSSGIGQSHTRISVPA